MTDATTDTGPIEGLITLEDLRVGLLDGIDRRGSHENVFLSSRRDGIVHGAVTGIEIDEDDDVVLLMDTTGHVGIGMIWNAVEGMCDDVRRDDPVFVKHARLGVIVGGIVAAGPDGDGDMILNYDFLVDALAEHADELQRLKSA